MRRTLTITSLLTLPLASACGDLELREDDAPVSTGPDASLSGADPSGTRTLTIDATNDKAWVHVDLDAPELPPRTDPSALPGWDLALSRFKIKLNGGVSGSAGVQASLRVGESFPDLREAPTEGYASDAPDGADDDLDPEYVLSAGEGGWWAYDPASHKLTPRPHVYVIESSERAYVKLALLGYYNQAGSAGYPTLTFAELAPPRGPTTMRDGGAGVPGAYDAGALDATTRASQP